MMHIFKKRPFVIGEIGVNYYDVAQNENISLVDAAILIIKKAKEAGVDGIKLQLYKKDVIESSTKGHWDVDEVTVKYTNDLFEKFGTLTSQDCRKIANYCREIKIMLLTTPYDMEDVKLLSKFVDVFVLSSFDLTDISFINSIAQKNLPLIISTGAATIKEIKDAVLAIENTSTIDLAIMHTVLSYPTKISDANLLMIKDLKENFPSYEIGYSDHTEPDNKMLILTTAYLYGADFIVKHITLDKFSKDYYTHSMDVNDLKNFKDNLNLIRQIRGLKNKQPLICEASARKHSRRSLIAIRDIKKGEIIAPEDITFKLSANGIPTSKTDKIIGLQAIEDIAKNSYLDFTMFE